MNVQDSIHHVSLRFLHRTPTAPDTITPEPWTIDALCTQFDPEMFFPENGALSRDAKKICAACPVRCCLSRVRYGRSVRGVWRTDGASTEEPPKPARRMSTHIEPVTVLDAETIAELQPPCEVDIKGVLCTCAAAWVALIHCVNSGPENHLFCGAHLNLLTQNGVFCNCHHKPIRVDNIEPLR